MCRVHARSDQERPVRVCSGPKRAFPILNTKAPRRIDRQTFNCFTQRVLHEPGKGADAHVEGDDIEAHQQSDTDCPPEMSETHLTARVSVPSRYSFALHEPLVITPFMYSIFEMRV